MNEFVIVGKILDFNSVDRQCEMIFPDCNIDFPEVVPMKHEWSEDLKLLLGFASLEKKEDGVWARMVFRFEDPKEMEAIKNLKPCIGGTVFEKEELDVFGLDGSVRSKKSLKILKKITINKIGICELNTDYSIKTLEEMENDTRT